MKSLHHFLVSLFISIIALLQGNISAAILCMLVGWLVDADHEIDHFIYTKKFVINPLKLGSELSQQFCGKMYVPLHSLEILYLMIVVSSVYNLSFLITIAYLCHLIMDIIGNDISLFDMSILVRWSRGWKQQKRWKQQKPKNL